MIEGNVIKFGYGDVWVKANGWIHKVGFQQFKPSQEPGTRVNPKEVDLIGEEIFIEFTRTQAMQIKESLNLMIDHENDEIINDDLRVIKFKEYVFDFTHYDVRSVKIVKAAMDLVIYGDPALAAC